jgi:glycine betaine/proline transport system ATP-binding protein
MALEEPRILVRNLWKIFGPKPHRAMRPEFQRASKAEVLRRLGNVIAIRDVSFEVYPGEVFVVMGLSGCGKSTLVRCLVRLIEPTAGEIKIDGEDVCAFNERQLIELRRRKVAMVFQHFGLFPHRTVLDNVSYGLEVRGVPKRIRYERAREALKLVGLEGWEESFPRQLSGGMQQRVGVARALAVEPEIMLMDEPFSGLDPLIRREMQEFLLQLQSQLQKTIVFITHDLHEALRLGNRIAIMREGIIIQVGTPQEIVTNPADAYVRAFTRDISPAKVLTAQELLQEAPVVLRQDATLHEAVKEMQVSDSPVAFIVDRAGFFLGLLPLSDARRAISDGVRSIRDVVRKEAPRVLPDVPVERLVPLTLTVTWPIAVVDEDGRLLGSVRQRDILDTIREQEG